MSDQARITPDAGKRDLFVACDFDGTIVNKDTLAEIIDHWAPQAWGRIAPLMIVGRITMGQAIADVFREVRTTQEEVLEYVLGRTVVRPGFGGLVAWLRMRGYGFMIVSSGFRSIIRVVLEREGLRDIAVCAGEAVFSVNGTTVSYPVPLSVECGSDCGCCKRDAVIRSKPADVVLVYVGDGMSDFCAAESADIVFARHSLAQHLESRGQGFYPFEDFLQVRRVLEDAVLNSLPPG